MKQNFVQNIAQARATHPQTNVWVSASAGSGKTKVLVDRILSLLLSGVEPRKILCLTFTRNAAAEMKQRLIQQLAQWAKADQAQIPSMIEPFLHDLHERKHQIYQRAQSLFSLLVDNDQQVRLLTIHGFCQMILQKFSLEAGLMPGFHILDEYQAQNLLRKTRQLILQNTEKYPSLITSLEYLSEKFSLLQLDEWITELMSLKWRAWLHQTQTNTHIFHSVVKSVSGTSIDEICNALIRNLSDFLDAILQGIHHHDLSNSTDQNLWDQFQALKVEENPQQYWKRISQIFLTSTGELRTKFFSQKINKLYPSCESYMREAQNIFLSHWEQYKLRNVYDTMQHIYVLAHAFAQEYAHLKNTQNKLDYDDLIHKTVELLESTEIAPWILYKLDGGIDHILVDEAQDTSSHQWRVIDAIVQEFFSGVGQKEYPRTLFVVGDIKQSIYSFQGADPHSFLKFREHYAHKAQISGQEWKDIPLNISYRSTQPILDVVDQTFSTPQTLQAIFSQTPPKHIAFRSDVYGKVELWPITETEDDTLEKNIWDPTDTQGNTKESYEILAEQIAETIASWIQQKRILPARGRPVQPQDILILVQRRHEFSLMLQKKLYQKDIPVQGVNNASWHENQLIRDLICMANVALLPLDSLNLAAVLKGPLFQLTDKDLMLIRQNEKLSLWEELTASPKYHHIPTKISEWSQLALQMKPADFFLKILYSDGNYEKFQHIYEDKTDAIANQFFHLVERSESQDIIDLQSFIQWYENVEAECKQTPEIGSGVRIMTTHGAKGLQAPIVILPDTLRMPSDISGLHLIPDNDDEFFMYIPSQKQLPDVIQPYKGALVKNQWAESYRLLYVAMTRAEDELYVCAWQTRRATSNNIPPWYQLIRQALLALNATETDDGKLIFSYGNTASLAAPQIKESSEYPLHIHIPKFWKVPSQLLYKVSPSALTPKHQDHTKLDFWEEQQPDDQARQAGIMIHRLLEVLPSYPSDQWRGITQKLLVPLVNEEKAFKILQNPNFSWIFQSNTFAEVSINGQYQNLLLSATLDRIGFDNDAVWCVDYKTSSQTLSTIDEVPDTYKTQMGAYGYLLQQLYPQKTINLYILWTHTGQLMELPFHQMLQCFQESVHEYITNS